MEAEITVRRAAVEDARDVSACLESAFEPFRSQYTRSAFEDTVLSSGAVQRRMEHMAVYVACKPDGAIVGTIGSTIDGVEWHLRGMAVLPGWQGRSVAEDLLHTAEHDLMEAGCIRLSLDTTVPLRSAIRFYEKNGFAASGRIMDFFGMQLHEYTKRLGPASFHQSG